MRTIPRENKGRLADAASKSGITFANGAVAVFSVCSKSNQASFAMTNSSLSCFGIVMWKILASAETRRPMSARVVLVD